MKKVVIISDLHCGSIYGLTPPKYFTDHHLNIQSESWLAYNKIARNWKKPDILICNGDMIEGTQSKQGGAELITPDRNVQCDMAIECINEFKAKQIFMTFGTAYHNGENCEDFEYQIAKRVGATIEGRLFLEIEGITFDVRHKVGNSTIPHGRATSLLKELAWDLIKEASGSGPKVDVIIRSHVHHNIWVEIPNKIAFITPALQAQGGRFGSRQCSGDIHWGAIRLTIKNGKIIGKDVDICTIQGSKPKVIKVE